MCLWVFSRHCSLSLKAYRELLPKEGHAKPCAAALARLFFAALRRGRCRRRAVAVGLRQHACLASALMHCGSLRARAAINIFMLKATAGVDFANDKTYNWLQSMAFCHVERAVLAAETARAAVRYVPFWGVEWH